MAKPHPAARGSPPPHRGTEELRCRGQEGAPLVAGRQTQPHAALPRFPCLHSEGVDSSLDFPGCCDAQGQGWGGGDCWSSTPLNSCVCCEPVKWVVPHRVTRNPGRPLARYRTTRLPTSCRRWLPPAPAVRLASHHPGPSGMSPRFPGLPSGPICRGTERTRLGGPPARCPLRCPV